MSTNRKQPRSNSIVMEVPPPFGNDRVAWTSPIVRWAGSKRKLLPLLLRAVPSKLTRYIEPFAGSACLFFGLRPSSGVLGELNAELIHAYEQVRLHPRILARKVRTMPFTGENYYRTRAIDPNDLSPLDRAARFVFLNRHCFNGVYRTNRLGKFNVPIGSETGSVPEEIAFVRCSIALRAANLRCMDFEETLSDVKNGDFVYLDPPYKLNGRKGYGEYGYGTFTDKDMSRLIMTIRHIDRVGGTFLLSYSDADELACIRRDWYCYRLTVRRHVAGFAKYRETVTEVLLSNQKLFV